MAMNQNIIRSLQSYQMLPFLTNASRHRSIKPSDGDNKCERWILPAGAVLTIAASVHCWPATPATAPHLCLPQMQLDGPKVHTKVQQAIARVDIVTLGQV